MNPRKEPKNVLQKCVPVLLRGHRKRGTEKRPKSLAFEGFLRANPLCPLTPFRNFWITRISLAHSFESLQGATRGSDNLSSETGQMRFQRVRFQTRSSVRFLALTEFRGENSVSSPQPIFRVPKRTHRVFRRTHRVCRQTQ